MQLFSPRISVARHALRVRVARGLALPVLLVQAVERAADGADDRADARAPLPAPSPPSAIAPPRRADARARPRRRPRRRAGCASLSRCAWAAYALQSSTTPRGCAGGARRCRCRRRALRRRLFAEITAGSPRSRRPPAAPAPMPITAVAAFHAFASPFVAIASSSLACHLRAPVFDAGEVLQGICRGVSQRARGVRAGLVRSPRARRARGAVARTPPFVESASRVSREENGARVPTRTRPGSSAADPAKAASSASRCAAFPPASNPVRASRAHDAKPVLERREAVDRERGRVGPRRARHAPARPAPSRRAARSRRRSPARARRAGKAAPQPLPRARSRAPRPHRQRPPRASSSGSAPAAGPLARERGTAGCRPQGPTRMRSETWDDQRPSRAPEREAGVARRGDQLAHDDPERAAEAAVLAVGPARRRDSHRCRHPSEGTT